MKHNYSIWYRKHLQTSLQLPSESLGASYAEKVMLNESSIQELVKQSTFSPVLTFRNSKCSSTLGDLKSRSFKRDIDDLWIISRLFAFDDWKEIRKTLRIFFNKNNH